MTQRCRVTKAGEGGRGLDYARLPPRTHFRHLACLCPAIHQPLLYCCILYSTDNAQCTCVVGVGCGPPVAPVAITWESTEQTGRQDSRILLLCHTTHYCTEPRLHTARRYVTKKAPGKTAERAGTVVTSRAEDAPISTTKQQPSCGREREREPAAGLLSRTGFYV